MNYRIVEKWKEIDPNQWNDWRWQLQNAIRSIDQLIDIVDDFSIEKPTWKQRLVLERINDSFEMKITPHTVLNIKNTLLNRDQIGFDALMNSFLPNVMEASRFHDDTDGIGEETFDSKPTSLVTNFYRNRVLFFVSNICASYCRFCFRRRKVGDRVDQSIERGTDNLFMEKALEYIRDNSEIREVIISGGDPLILSDSRIFDLLKKLRSINHIKTLRIDTKVPSSLPQRITKELIEILRQFQPIYIVGHFLHPVELTEEVIDACKRLVEAGIIVSAHTPLLRKINDNEKILEELMWKLFENRILPYYLIQFIPTKWTEHFRVPIARALEIMKWLHEHLPGLAIPTYIVYLPGGAGKVPVTPNYLVTQTDDGCFFQNLEGKLSFYREHEIKQFKDDASIPDDTKRNQSTNNVLHSIF
ncbi:KamA family radical SAM protein [candidate division KSB1 bacterium]|nr:MAG: KamA family radical SAM protein [candidate division KSB1 bacterium]MBC6949719.1 KamA family radical SAM protein [candidate division KSB1 bacterium]MCE7944521.1 KamA family radical SAM protein [Chlorobi bacterium CHB1]MDL1876338.1 KamA family radical SAM protein [Cytophagia bacterium CHB2]